MFVLRRTAARALSATPSKTFFLKPRTFTSYTASIRPTQQSSIISQFQKRFSSDEATKNETAESAAAVAEEIAQTKPEAPVEENLTPAQEQAQHNPEDSSATVHADALEQVGEGRPRQRSNNRLNMPPVPPNKILYVGNLFYEVTEDQLQRIFSRFGNVNSVRIITDNRGMSRGFAYVEYETVEEATSAVENLDMQVFEGRNLVVAYHKQRENAPPNPFRRPGASDTTPSKTLFIGNMSYDMTDKDLNDMFRDIRNVVDVRVAIDRRTGQPRGFAHADFLDVQSAQAAMEQLKGKAFHDRMLRIDFSQPQANNRNRERAPRE